MAAHKRRKMDEVNGGDRLSQEKSSIKDTYRKKTKCFSDLAHGDLIELNEALVKVINTPEFGRLQYIKQTGSCFLVFPSATHTRFSHSLGTCYLAGEVMKRLQEQQPELEINDRDVLCVELAALLHDIGHGPYSHMFDQIFIPLCNPNVVWQHEDASKAMFRHLLEKNPDVKEYLDGILLPEDYIFVEEAITPVDEEKSTEWPYKGRPKEKAFLYDIVSNKCHGFDVDKWDYVKRDAAHMSVSINANLIRLLKNLQVLEVGRQRRPTICYRDKVEQDLSNLATTRAQLHMAAYQHRTVKVIEMMIVDALLIADQYLRLPGTNGEQLRMSETIHDMEAYKLLTDNMVFGLIPISTMEELKPARAILERVQRRQLYAKVAQADKLKMHEDEADGNPNYWKQAEIQIAGYLLHLQESFTSISEDQLARALVVMISDIHGGMKSANPVEKVWLYKKNSVRPERHQKPHLAAPVRQKIMRVFCRENDDELIRCARACFKFWCDENDYGRLRDIMDDEEHNTIYPSRPSSVLKDNEMDEPDKAEVDAAKKNLLNDFAFN